jgi:two-component system OmpR family response regulator/two-component system response regulator QseB
VRLLLIEDDAMVGRALVDALSHKGCAVDWIRDGQLAESAMVDAAYAAILLDLGLPRRSGMALLRSVRARDVRTPIIVVTAKDAVADRIEGLDAGADDYVLKPFEVGELQARLRSVLRRRAGHADALIGTKRLQLDLNSHEALFEGGRVALTAREFSLLRALLERPGAILSREQLEGRIYGWGDAVTSNAVEFIIHGLRKRLRADAIRNVRGLGWLVPKDGA